VTVGTCKEINSAMTAFGYRVIGNYMFKKYIAKLAVGYPKMINYKKEDLSMPKEFIYYRIADIISDCLKYIIHYKRKLSLAEFLYQYHMKIWLCNKKYGNAQIHFY
jgi:hypothetical protein